MGIGGRKPAKDFTLAERGKVKHKYYKKGFWDLVQKMINSSLSVNLAIDKVYDAYGYLGSITKILRMIKKDKSRGGHPQM